MNANITNFLNMYLNQGFAVTPLKGKTPVRSGWPDEKLTADEAYQVFSGSEYNIGITLGRPSGGLVDVDLDDELARKIGPALLPPTGMRFGRGSVPASHLIYRVTTPGKPRQFVADNQMIVELRSQGNQTMFPGSVHPNTLETIEFQEAGEPALTSWDELEAKVIDVAVATMLAQNWKLGTRHSLSLAAAGALANAGRGLETVERIVSVVAACCCDEEQEDRIRGVRDTFSKFDAGHQVAGVSALVHLIGNDGRQIGKWLGVNAVPGTSLRTICLDTDNDRAEAFAAANRGRRYYSTNEGRWYQRSHDVLRPKSNEAMLDAVVSSGISLLVEGRAPSKDIQKFFSVAGAKNILTMAHSKLEIDSEQFDLDPILLGCSNGVLSLTERRLTDPGDALITKTLGTDFRPNATCPQFERFVNSLFAGDSEIIDFVQRAVGYSLSGSTSEQCLFVLVGNGANGKSTLLNVISELMGEYGGSTPMQTLMAHKYGNQATNDLAALVGKRFVSAAEGEAGAKLAEAKIKRMTGGDPIVCRHLYREFFQYLPQFKLWLATNDLPKIEGTSEGIWRRINVVEFPVTFAPEERDAQLSQKLRKELPGILNWALEGFRKWQEDGRLIRPSKVQKATDAYRRDNDTVRLFVEVCCEREKGARAKTSELFRAYEAWCGFSGFDPLPIARFGKELGRLGFDGFRSATGNGWKGISLNDEAQPF